MRAARRKERRLRQHVCARAKGRQRIDRLLRQTIAQLAGGLYAQRADQRALVAARVLGDALAHGRLVALGVQNIVGDLERGAKRLSIGDQRGALIGVGAGKNSARFRPKAQQCPGLHRLQLFYFRPRKRDARRFGCKIEHLPARHAAKARSARQPQHQLATHGCIGMGCGIGHHVEGVGEQAVASQNCGRLVKSAMDGGRAPAQIVVVHGGQVVMNQRIAMHQLQRAGRAQHARA